MSTQPNVKMEQKSHFNEKKSTSVKNKYWNYLEKLSPDPPEWIEKA